MINKNSIDKNELSIIEQPKGDIEIIQKMLCKQLQYENSVKLAYILVIQYKFEKTKRLGLFLDCKTMYKDVLNRIAKFSFDNLGEIDILFLKDLPLDVRTNIINNFIPFYKKDDSL